MCTTASPPLLRRNHQDDSNMQAWLPASCNVSHVVEEVIQSLTAVSLCGADAAETREDLVHFLPNMIQMDSKGDQFVNGVQNGCTKKKPAFEATHDHKSKPRLDSLDEFWRLHRMSLEDPDTFWREAATPFFWKSPIQEKNILNYNFDITKGEIFVEMFKGATTNICYNALDRNVQLGHGEQVAYFWIGNDPQDADQITYRELLRRVCRFANVLKSKGVKKGDMVAMYMPMIPELVIAMYACARIGAIHSVVFGGYSAESLADRLADGNCKIVVTADGVWRATKFVHLKNIVDRASEICKDKNHHLTSVIIVQHQMNLTSTKKLLMAQKNGPQKMINGVSLDISWNPELDVWYHDEMAKASDVCEPVWVDSEHLLFTLYTSGSTGKPKGCAHITGAYMVYGALSFKYVFDYFPGDIFFCTGDIGWLTAHTYTVYGSLLNSATCIIYEGVPTHPTPSRYWEIIEKYGVTQFYTAPTAIRTLMAYDDSFITKHDRSSLRLLGTVGEPINEDAWHWYHRLIGEGRCPIVDTYWQTETGGHLLTPMPFCTPLKPGCAALPFFGVDAAILDDDGKEVKGPGKGFLVMKRPWPAIMRTVFGDHERYQNIYFKPFPGYYFTGDGGRRDEDGLLWVTGRVDDMLNVSGRMLSTTEVEAALKTHNGVFEAAAVRHSHPVKGECIYCFVVVKPGYKFDEALVRDLSIRVEKQIGAFARPDYFHQAETLPKTRTGKTVRRVLRKIAENEKDVGDLTTLIDDTVVPSLFSAKKFQNGKPPMLLQ